MARRTGREERVEGQLGVYAVQWGPEGVHGAAVCADGGGLFDGAAGAGV